MKQKILVTALISIGFSLSGTCLAAPPTITKPNASVAAPDKAQIPAATGSEAGQSLDKKPGGIAHPGKLTIPQMNNSAGNDGGIAAPGRSDGNSNQGGGGIVTVPGQSSSSRPGGVGGFAIPGGSEGGGGNVTVPGRSGGSSNQSGTIRRRSGDAMEGGGEKPVGFFMGAPQDVKSSDPVTITPAKPGPGKATHEKPGYKPDNRGPADKEKDTRPNQAKDPKKPEPNPDNDSGTPNDNNMGSGGSTKLKGRAGDLDKPVRNEEMGSGGSQKISKDKGTTDGTGEDESGDSKNIGNSLSQGKNPLINPVDR